MTDAKPAGEPSMEEILASIRQIINQNDKPAEGPASPDAPAAPSVASAAPIEQPAAVSFATTPDAAIADNAPEEEEVLELTEILNEAAAAEIAPPPKPIFQPEPVIQSAPAPAPSTPNPAVQPMPTELISNTSAAAATAALSTLATTLHQERMEHSLPLGNNARTLESMAVEALKPLLKEWLDANLPAIVERIVQQEVEKLTKRLGA